ncbi:General secretion pathway protein D [Castellaniella defragrans 65Phen]|uniref:General secretion pathway protein D n=1 Tax=Castellaniella defragrans (strain DSM 12143 / CCUG 39792 / 65Phen) TaxID=1437824 RepID=W8X971_CASD6|nr:type II secretion system secretin GspD [Castellaniella defragrans]CDM24315.1 General secretion pathway protein D [Castellaniella defragrans 65Phen]
MKRETARYLPLLLSVLALGGCAVPDAARQAQESPLVVRTSVGSAPSVPVGRPARADEPRQAPRPRRLQPIAERPGASAAAPGASADGPMTRLNFQEADLGAVVRALASFTGRNFLVDPRVRGQLTLVSDAPVDADTAYAMLLGALRMQGFAVVEVGGVSRVVPEADAKLLGGAVVSGAEPARRGELQTRVFALRYENAADLVPVLRPLVAANNTLAAQEGSNSLVVTDYADNLERIAQIIARIDTPLAVNTDVVPIEYGVALDVAALAQQLLQDGSGRKTRDVSVLADPRSNSVLLRAITPERLKQARQLILRLDTPESRTGNLHVVYLRNAQASHLAEVLRGALTGQGGSTDALDGPPLSATQAQTGLPAAALSSSQGEGAAAALPAADARSMAFSAGGATIQADSATNTLIISAPEPLYRSLREVIDLLDQRRAQVLIESLIVEVNADKAAEFGVQWMAGGNSLNGDGAAFFGGANLGGTGIGLDTATRTTIDALGQGLNLGVINGTVNVMGTQILNLSVLARAMQRHGGVNVLSTPNLMTLDNEEASIIVGNTVPFVTGSYTTSGDGASNPFQTVQREDVGLTLRIRPQISEGGTVKLALYQEVSSLVPTASQNGTSDVTRKRALETSVLVDDGQIIVLGGLLEDRMDDSTSSVPLLGDIPVLGNLFKYQKRNHTKTNLMLFLRPHIVRTAQDGARLTLDRYNFMRAAQAGLPVQASWLMPDDVMTDLPALQRDPGTGLLDLRGFRRADEAAPAAGAPADPDAAPAVAAPVGRPGAR